MYIRRMDMSDVTEKKQVAFIACAAASAGPLEVEGKSNPVVLKAESTTCKEAVESGFDRGECKYGCVGGGDCVHSCKAGAIILKDGVLTIDREKCDGCGDCAKEGVCVQGIIKMIPAEATNFIPCANCDEDEHDVRELCGFGCVGCGDCERVCPNDAVSVIDNHAVIDYDKCEGCDACTAKCRKKIIVDTLHDITELKERIAFVKCSGDFSNMELLSDHGYTSCAEAAEKASLDDYDDFCPYGCMGLGDCERACRYDAIKVVNGVAEVDTEKCVGCKDCTYVCPKDIIAIKLYKGSRVIPCSAGSKAKAVHDDCVNSCTGCGACAANCPNGAIFMKGGKAVVDSEYCDNCHICEYVCQRNIVKRINVPEDIYLQNLAMEREMR